MSKIGFGMGGMSMGLVLNDNKIYKQNCEQLKEKTDNLYKIFKKFKDNQDQINDKTQFDSNIHEFMKHSKQLKEECENKFSYNSIQFSKDLLEIVDEQKYMDQFLQNQKDIHDKAYKQTNVRLENLKNLKNIFWEEIDCQMKDSN